MWGRWSTPLGRLTPAAFGRTPAAEARRTRKRDERLEYPRPTRREWLALMRRENPDATRADVTAALREQARTRRADLL